MLWVYRMTPQKARLLTITEIDEMSKLWIYEDNMTMQRVLATARAAMKVVEAEKLKDSCGGLSDFISIKSRIDIAMKPFQQTGEEKE